jgi:diaminopimelate epimerase
MTIPFYKYQGTGNDFIIIDNRNNFFNNYNNSFIARLCNRQFGIGADGLILLSNKNGYDFEMTYYNSDGNQSSMCGNGGRCIVAFALKKGIVENTANFIAFDGVHKAIILDYKDKNAIIKLKMNDVTNIEQNNSSFFLNTGSPHHVEYVENIEKYDVFNQGKNIRNSKKYFSNGTNVDFIEQYKDYLFVRTYERGVENETLSCGSGVTASALIAAINNKSNPFVNKYIVKTLGGFLTVHFEKVSDTSFRNIWLEGPATFVFTGEIEI